MSLRRTSAHRLLAWAIALACVLGLARPATPVSSQSTIPSTGNPILFVTQLPIRPDFTTIGSTFGNHLAGVTSAGRGGDLWIRYPDGTLKNLTAAAGYGVEGFQGANAIAVRDPSVHWSGTKALFSMVIGAPTRQHQSGQYFWQIYEITGLGRDDTPRITKVPGQPERFNNISPIYDPQDRIIFTSDRPRSGAAHLYPQLDEYELAPTNTGLWSLDPASGDLRLLNHAPSGDFTPIVDSFGRVVFTQWDHLQRDQQADADAEGGSYGTFDYADESAQAARLNTRTEVFPEPRPGRDDLLAGTGLSGHRFNHFFPWQINPDGTDSEVLNHLGRHELHGYIDSSRTDDPRITEFYRQYPRHNPNPVENLLQIKEDPTQPGRYYAVDAPEFGTHASGQIVRFDAPPNLDADHVTITYVTPRVTRGTTDTPNPAHSGHYREPLPLANGLLLAVHTPETREDAGQGSLTASRYDFRIRVMLTQGDTMVAGPALTDGIVETISFWSPDTMITYTGPLWELNPVEVRARPRPTPAQATLPAPEQQAFDAAGVDPAELRAYLERYGLALLVSRNVTSRDDLDRQQPFNLRVPGGVQSTTGTGRVYDVTHLQFFQADQVRGWTGGGNTPRPGRRVLARHMHDESATRFLDQDGPPSSVAIAADGSMAALVPAQRAVTWQLTDEEGTGVVRERYWLTFQPGEIRVCASCHGLSERDQMGRTQPINTPDALIQILEQLKVELEREERMTNQVYIPVLPR